MWIPFFEENIETTAPNISASIWNMSETVQVTQLTYLTFGYSCEPLVSTIFSQIFVWVWKEKFKWYHPVVCKLHIDGVSGSPRWLPFAELGDTTNCCPKVLFGIGATVTMISRDRCYFDKKYICIRPYINFSPGFSDVISFFSHFFVRCKMNLGGEKTSKIRKWVRTGKWWHKMLVLLTGHRIHKFVRFKKVLPSQTVETGFYSRISHSTVLKCISSLAPLSSLLTSRTSRQIIIEWICGFLYSNTVDAVHTTTFVFFFHSYISQNWFVWWMGSVVHVF